MIKVKRDYLLFFFALFVFGLNSCVKNEPEEWEYSNTGLDFDIVSEDGKSLVNPLSKQGAEWLQKIVIEYNGEKYFYQGQPVRETRAITERYKSFNAIRIEKRFYLHFGEFQPNYKEKQTLKLHLPKGDVKEIRFVHYAEGGKFISKMWHDGKEVEGRMIKIVSKPYLAEGEKEIPLSVYVYLASRQLLTPPDLPEEFLSMKISYKEKDYQIPLKMDEPGEAEFGFRKEIGKLLPLAFTECFYFKFGPFHPGDNHKNEEFELIKGEHKFKIQFSCYLDEKGEVVYEAADKNGTGQTKRLFFKNGPLVVLPL
ncbi:hypothetical protein [Porphyromonas macacae]|nr:hypothetical protein [Porphyromonas macacae]